MEKKMVFYKFFKTLNIITFVFLIILCALMVNQYIGTKKISILDDKYLNNLKSQVEQDKNNSELKNKIRDLDYLYRKAWFSGQEQIDFGIKLIITGLLIFIITAAASDLLKKNIPEMPDKNDLYSQNINAIYKYFFIILPVLIILLFIYPSKKKAEVENNNIPQNNTGNEDIKTVKTIENNEVSDTFVSGANAVVDYSKIFDNWAMFRGSASIGVSKKYKLPENLKLKLKWKIKSEKKGFSSPVIWEEKIIVTSADSNKLYVYCYNINSGALIWKYEKAVKIQLKDKYNDEPGFASPTGACDGERIYSIFGTGDLICLDMTGKLIWEYSFGMPKINYGYASSILQIENYIIVQMDDETPQTLYAFNSLNGKILWKNERQSDVSWSSPAFINYKNKKLIAALNCKSIEMFELETGKILWTKKILGGEVATAAAFNDTFILVASDNSCATALNPVTGDTIWLRRDLYLPDVASPVAYKNNFFIFTSGGDIVCVNAETGGVKWNNLAANGFYSSPLIADNKIINADLYGKIILIKIDDEKYKELGSIEVKEEVKASLAFGNKKIFVRGIEHIFCYEW